MTGYCPKCGEAKKDQNYCDNCGKELDEQKEKRAESNSKDSETEEVELDAKENSSTGIGLDVGILLVGIFLGIVLGVMFYTNQGNSMENTEKSASEINSDNDGIVNSDDKCPNQGEQGSGVKDNGCPKVDSDGDGVADSEDDFPNDRRCQTDTDNDEICDAEDPLPQRSIQSTDLYIDDVICLPPHTEEGETKPSELWVAYENRGPFKAGYSSVNLTIWKDNEFWKSLGEIAYRGTIMKQYDRKAPIHVFEGVEGWSEKQFNEGKKYHVNLSINSGAMELTKICTAMDQQKPDTDCFREGTCDSNN